MTDPENEVDLGPMVERFHVDVVGELNDRLGHWKPDFRAIQTHEVIGAMLARQATLVLEIARAPTIWNGHAAPILLRAMADVHINIAWLTLEPETRCLKFISYGLGQAKLEVEHRIAQIGDRERTPEEVDLIEGAEHWIDEQRMRFLQDVDLGKWSGLSVRDMAREADCDDFYSYVYTPFSAAAHSMWHHIGRYNLARCKNPLHRYHRVPGIIETDLSPHYLLLAAKYWQKTLNVFDAFSAHPGEHETALDRLSAALAEALAS